MSKKMLIDAAHKEEVRVVVLDSDGKLDDYEIESTVKTHSRGSIYVGEVTRVEPSLQAAFISFGGNRNGFLAFSEVHPSCFQLPEEEKAALLEEYNAVSPWGQSDDEDDSDAETSTEDQKADDAAENSADVKTDAKEAAPAEDDGKRRPKRRGRKDEKAAEEAETAETAAKPEPEKLIEVAAKDAAISGQGLTFDELEEDARALALANAIAVKPVADPEGSNVRGGRRDHRRGGRGRPERHARGERSNDRSDRPERNDRSSNNRHDGRPRPVPVHRRYEMANVIKPGQKILVQVVKEERGTKGAALTTFVSLPGRYTVLMPNTPYAGGISRKITDQDERRELKSITSQLEVPKGMGLIVRTAGLGQSIEDIRRDVQHLQTLWTKLGNTWPDAEVPSCVYEEGNLIVRALRDMLGDEVSEVAIAGSKALETAKDYISTLMPDFKGVREYKGSAPIFAHYGVEMELHQLHRTRVTLPSGGYLIINPTEALVSVDVNSGRATQEKNIEQTAYQTNLEAARELARQLRLRDLAGLIVVDFIDMEDRRHDRTVERTLKEAVRRDRARIQIGGISDFGLLEMSRQRLRPSLGETSFVACPHCNGSGQVRSPASAALMIMRRLEEDDVRGKADRIVVTTSTAVAVYMLNHKRDMIRDYEETNKTRVMIMADDKYSAPDHRLDLIRVSADGSEKSQTLENVYREDIEDTRSNNKRRKRRRGKDEAPRSNTREARSKDDGEDSRSNRRGGRDRDRNRDRRSRNQESSDKAAQKAAEALGVDVAKEEKPAAEAKPEKAEKPRRGGRKPKADAKAETKTEAKPEAKTAAAEKPAANGKASEPVKAEAKPQPKPVNTPVLVERVGSDEAATAAAISQPKEKKSALQRWWNKS